MLANMFSRSWKWLAIGALFAGLVRTHTPLYAPKKYFDRFPLESIELLSTPNAQLEGMPASPTLLDTWTAP